MHTPAPTPAPALAQAPSGALVPAQALPRVVPGGDMASTPLATTQPTPSPAPILAPAPAHASSPAPTAFCLPPPPPTEQARREAGETKLDPESADCPENQDEQGTPRAAGATGAQGETRDKREEPPGSQGVVEEADQQSGVARGTSSKPQRQTMTMPSPRWREAAGTTAS